MTVEIKDNTITIAVDVQGGMCDRLMLGSKGIINNACASLECWKFNAPDDEDIQEMQYPTTLEDALAILFTDNFHVEIVTNNKKVQELLSDNEVNIDFNNILFDKDNIYKIY